MMYPGYDGGQEWGGSAFDPATNRLIVNSSEIGAILQLYEVPVGFSARAVYAEQCGTCHGGDRAGNAVGPSLIDVGERLTAREINDVVRNGRGRMTGFDHLDEIEIRAAIRYIRNPEEEEDLPPSTEVDYAFGGYTWLRDQDGLPGNRTPWGTLTSVDLATGDFDWQVTFGDYPQTVGQGLGSESYGGPVVTASGLIFIAATPDRKIRAHDTRDGSLLWEAELPAAGFTTPAVYAVDGRQFVVIAAGGGRMGPPSGSEYIAFALP
jgi:quinoprotein glucose dehydrogenase